MMLHNRILRLRALQNRNIAETNNQIVEPAQVHRIYPAAVDVRTLELYKLIDELRADRDAWREQAQRLALRVSRRRWWWSRNAN
jgi:hypothetical protein